MNRAATVREIAELDKPDQLSVHACRIAGSTADSEADQVDVRINCKTVWITINCGKFHNKLWKNQSKEMLA